MKNFLLKVFLFAFLFGALIFSSQAQLAPTKYWIQFDSKVNSPFTVENPSAYLSERSIQRRLKQNISITSEDFPVDLNYLLSLQNAGAKILNPSKWLNGTTVQVIDSTLLPGILNHPFVVNMIPLKRVARNENSNAPLKLNQDWIVSASQDYSLSTLNYGAATAQIRIHNGDFLHESGYRGKGIIIAVLDAGFEKIDQMNVFDSLFASGRLLGRRDFVDGDNSVEEHNHGTAVLSTMAAYLPGRMIGTAPEASYYLMRTEDGATETLIEEYNWVSAAEFADSLGVDIITSSLGYSTFNNSLQDHQYSDMDGISTPVSIGADKAFSKGMLVVCSAGNEGQTGWKYLVAPSDGIHVLGVGAVDSLSVPAPFSSYGPSADGRIKPNVAAIGRGTFIVNSNDAIVPGNGTSFACPIIAGMSACLWQGSPNASNRELKDAIEKSASQYSNPDTRVGYGVPNFSTALYALKSPGGIEPNEDRMFNINNNPFHEQFSFSFYAAESQNVRMQVFDVLGRRVYFREEFLLEKSYNYFEIILNSSGKGVFFLRFDAKAGAYTIKLLKN